MGEVVGSVVPVGENAGPGPLDVTAAGLEGTDVGGADVFGEEHPSSATNSTNPSSSLWRVLIVIAPSSAQTDRIRSSFAIGRVPRPVRMGSPGPRLHRAWNSMESRYGVATTTARCWSSSDDMITIARTRFDPPGRSRR